MSRRAWLVVSIMSWVASVVVAFALGAWWATNQPPLPIPGVS